MGVEAGELHRRELDLSALVERLQREVEVHEDVISRLLEKLAADELALNDLRAIRDALTPPELASRPGVDLAASFLPATEGVSGDFYLVADAPHEPRHSSSETWSARVWERHAERRSSARCSRSQPFLG